VAKREMRVAGCELQVGKTFLGGKIRKKEEVL
jgi:hypothetical protein